MKHKFVVAAVIAFCFVNGISTAATSYSSPDESMLSRAGLPEQRMAKAALSAGLMHRHPQWIDISAGSNTVRSFVVFPERPDKAPVIILTANNPNMSDWLRAVGDDAAAQGFIAVVPLSAGADAVTKAAINMPASNGNGASVKFAFENGTGHIDMTVESPQRLTRSFAMTEHSWHNTLAFLSSQINTFAPPAQARREGDVRDDR